MMDWITAIDLENHWWWLILAVVLGIGEILLPGVFLIWIAIAAAATGLIAMATGIGAASQIVLFAVLCLLATWLGRRWYVDNPVPSQDPLLNDRAARLIGEVVTVVEAIEDGRGRVSVGDGAWPCRGPDAPVGAKVRVTGSQGAALVVEPA
jgi:membrane protein implicated in regulation of membrane protease activity